MIKAGSSSRRTWEFIKACFLLVSFDEALANFKKNWGGLFYFYLKGWESGVVENAGLIAKTHFLLVFDIADLLRMPTFLIRQRAYQVLAIMTTCLISIGMTIGTADARNLYRPDAWARFYLAANIPLVFAMLLYLLVTRLYLLLVSFWLWAEYVVYHMFAAMFGRINPMMAPVYFILDLGVISTFAYFVFIVCLKPPANFLFGRHNCMMRIFWDFYDFIQRKYIQKKNV